MGARETPGLRISYNGLRVSTSSCHSSNLGCKEGDRGFGYEKDSDFT